MLKAEHSVKRNFLKIAAMASAGSADELHFLHVHERRCRGSLPIPVAVVMKLTSQKRRKLPPRRQGPKTMEVVTRDRKKKMVISSTILNSRYVLGRYSPSLRSLRAQRPSEKGAVPSEAHALIA